MSAKPTPTPYEPIPWAQRLWLIALFVVVVIGHTLEFNAAF
jgi:hypothetical protein